MVAAVMFLAFGVVMASAAAATVTAAVAAMMLLGRCQQFFQVNQPALRGPFLVRGGIDPERQHRAGDLVLEGQDDLIHDLARVEGFQHEGRGFALVFVPDGDLPGDGIGQGIDKVGGRREVFHRRRKMGVVRQGSAAAEHQHGAVLPGLEAVRLVLDQHLRQQYAQLGGRIHLEELGIIPHLLTIQGGQIHP